MIGKPEPINSDFWDYDTLVQKHFTGKNDTNEVRLNIEFGIKNIRQ